MENINEALIARLEKTVKDGFDELKSIMNAIEGRVRKLEEDNARICSTQELRMSALEKKHDDDHEELEELSKQVQGLDDRVKLIMWVGGIIGAAVILYILNGWLALL